jgi:hypothetical protein
VAAQWRGDLDEHARGEVRIGQRIVSHELHAAALCSLSTPRKTILIASSGRGRRSAFAHPMVLAQTSRSSALVKMTGIAWVDWCDEGLRRDVLRKP